MYLVDQKSGKRFYSRTDILWSTSKVSDLKVIYPNGYDSIDWSKEPPYTLQELYKLRAQQLRDNSNYIILYFSGGSDSITVLNSFIKNNIKVDEIVITAFSDIDNSKVDGKYALYYLKKINYSGKVSIVNLTYNILNTINSKQLWYNLGYYTGLIHVLSRARITWYEENNFISSTIRPENCTHLYGGAGILIKVFDNKYYAEISASSLGMASFHKDNEQFFTTPDFPILHSKQCHIVVNYWKKQYPKDIVIREADYKTNKIVKSLVRDEFKESVSAQKGSSNLLSFNKPNTESSIILSTYRNKDISFYKTYIDSTIRDFYNTFQYKDNNGTFLDPSLNKRFYLSETTY